VLQADELQGKAMTPLLETAGVPSYGALLKLSDLELVAEVWRSSKPVLLPSMYPKNFVYTFGLVGL